LEAENSELRKLCEQTAEETQKMGVETRKLIEEGYQ
jgi:hypothetical protein